jgi:flagellar biosynthetic protein FliR
VTIVFAGVQLAGHVIGQLGGMSLAETYNPTIDTNLPLFSQYLYIFGLAIFVLIGGHRLMLIGLLDTFASLPPGGATLSMPVVETLSTLVTQSFAFGIRAAAPGTVALLLVTLVLGLLSRTLPQLNVMSLGFGLNALATLATLWVSLGTLIYLLHEHFEPAIELILEAMAAK